METYVLAMAIASPSAAAKRKEQLSLNSQMLVIRNSTDIHLTISVGEDDTELPAGVT
ncbi:MAG: hypothetical protein SGPRY_001490, partial [Prymnesium sp.]